MIRVKIDMYADDAADAIDTLKYLSDQIPEVGGLTFDKCSVTVSATMTVTEEDGDASDPS